MHGSCKYIYIYIYIYTYDLRELGFGGLGLKNREAIAVVAIARPLLPVLVKTAQPQTARPWFRL